MGNSHSNLEYRENAGRNRTIDRLRKSVRASFRKRKRDSTKWGDDEIAVRNSVCNFPVKYLGCVEVYESRGMQTCEDALEELRKSRKHPIRATLHISGDGIRVVEDETKGLLVDQTIEKVSFCAPDRNNDRGFSYICREGTTRRWMCYGFQAARDSGERLSHAVGCAFTVCLEKKTNRDKESVAFLNSDSSTFIRTGSFRQTTLTERLTDPQQCKPAEPPPLKPVTNPHAVARPHATTSLLQRQASCHRFGKLDRASPFKRQLSLRISDLPSTQARQQAMCLSVDKQPPIAEVSPMSETPPNHVKKELPVEYDNICISNELDNYSSDNSPAVLHLQEQTTVEKKAAESKNPFLPFPDISNANAPPMQQPLKSTSKNELASKTLSELAQEFQAHPVPANDISPPGDFDKKWTALDNSIKSASNTIKTFEVQM